MKDVLWRVNLKSDCICRQKIQDGGREQCDRTGRPGGNRSVEAENAAKEKMRILVTIQPYAGILAALRRKGENRRIRAYMAELLRFC